MQSLPTGLQPILQKQYQYHSSTFQVRLSTGYFFYFIEHICMIDVYLCVVLWIRDFNLDRMTSRLNRVYMNYNVKSISLEISRALENSVRSTGCASFISFRAIQDSESSAHLTSNFQPTVVFLIFFCPLLVTTYMLLISIATSLSLF